MIILDTNVVSALMLDRADAQAGAWLDQQISSSLWLTAITVFEISNGLLTMPPGRRQRRLAEEFNRLLSEEFEKRLLPVDRGAATEAARISAKRKAAGRPVDLRDTLIGGIAMSREATIATRNIRHFDDLPITVVNPWAP